MMLLDGVIVGKEVIVVGERGTILHTTPDAGAWRQVPSSVGATLTAIAFAPDGRHGWAVGHDALILATTDEGRGWRVQYRGPDVQESFLDVLALDARRVIAVGGYGLYLSTADGGASWTRRKLLDDDFHLNRISRGPAGTLYLAGEHGTLLKSSDEGANWTAIRTPYEGSLYGVLPLDAKTLLAYGLRGHLYRSDDDGANWRQIPTPQPVLLATAVHTRSGHLVLAGQTRGLIASHNLRGSFIVVPEPGTAVAELLEMPDGRVLALGDAGATIVSLGGP